MASRRLDNPGSPPLKLTAMKRPQLSFAKVLWPLDPPCEMVRVSGARHHVADTRAAADAIAADGSFLPARAWLVQDQAEPGDPDAVSVYFPTARGAYRAGVIAKRSGRLFRLQMDAIGRPGETLEVCVCIHGHARDERKTVQVYLPEDFDQFVAAGYDRDPANRPAWLADPSPVAPRAVVSHDGSEFSPDELRKVYCRFAKVNGWPSLPDSIEQAVQRRSESHASLFRQMMVALARGAAFIVMGAAILTGIPGVAAETFTARVVSVHDGDTITALADGNRQVKVRLAGIDAPELGQPYGQAAKGRLSKLAFGKTVEIEVSDKDRWGRTIGVVEIDGKPAGEVMISEGLAWHYARYSDDQRLARAEREARQARRGLWHDPQPVPPWEWREQGRERKAKPVLK